VVTGGIATVTIPTHGLVTDTRITISGSLTSGMNTNAVINTVTGANTFTLYGTFPDGTYSESSLRVSTTQPRTADPVWTIQRIYYSGSTISDLKTSLANQICDNRAATGSLKIAYQ
jgi:hypothetical protein